MRHSARVSYANVGVSTVAAHSGMYGFPARDSLLRSRSSCDIALQIDHSAGVKGLNWEKGRRVPLAGASGEMESRSISPIDQWVMVSLQGYSTIERVIRARF